MTVRKLTETKMRVKNVTVLPFCSGLQWTVHENKALDLSPGAGIHGLELFGPL